MSVLVYHTILVFISSHVFLVQFSCWSVRVRDDRSRREPYQTVPIEAICELNYHRAHD